MRKLLGTRTEFLGTRTEILGTLTEFLGMRTKIVWDLDGKSLGSGRNSNFTVFFSGRIFFQNEKILIRKSFVVFERKKFEILKLS